MDNKTPRWSNKSTISLLQYLKGYPCLWDVSNNIYLKPKEKIAALSQISAMFKKSHGINISTEAIRKKIVSTRQRVRQELKKIEVSKKSGAGVDSVYVPEFDWFRSADFLFPGCTITKPTSTLKLNSGIFGTKAVKGCNTLKIENKKNPINIPTNDVKSVISTSVSGDQMVISIQANEPCQSNSMSLVVDDSDYKYLLNNVKSSPQAVDSSEELLELPDPHDNSQLQSYPHNDNTPEKVSQQTVAPRVMSSQPNKRMKLDINDGERVPLIKKRKIQKKDKESTPPQSSVIMSSVMDSLAKIDAEQDCHSTFANDLANQMRKVTDEEQVNTCRIMCQYLTYLMKKSKLTHENVVKLIEGFE